DLEADHFEAGRRLSDPNFWKQANPNPREGFFRVSQGNTPTFSLSFVPGGGATNTVNVPSILGQDWIIQVGSWVLIEDLGGSRELVYLDPNYSSVTPTSFTTRFMFQHGDPTGSTLYQIRPLEGVDADNIPSSRATEHILHMAV